MLGRLTDAVFPYELLAKEGFVFVFLGKGCLVGVFVFLWLLLAKTPYTLLLPAGLAVASVLVLAAFGGCMLVVAFSASRTT